MFKCSNVQMFKCSNVQMFKCSNIKIVKCSAKCTSLAQPSQQSWNVNTVTFHILSANSLPLLHKTSTPPIPKHQRQTNFTHSSKWSFQRCRLLPVFWRQTLDFSRHQVNINKLKEDFYRKILCFEIFKVRLILTLTSKVVKPNLSDKPLISTFNRWIKFLLR